MLTLHSFFRSVARANFSAKELAKAMKIRWEQDPDAPPIVAFSPPLPPQPEPKSWQFIVVRRKRPWWITRSIGLNILGRFTVSEVQWCATQNGRWQITWRIEEQDPFMYLKNRQGEPIRKRRVYNRLGPFLLIRLAVLWLRSARVRIGENQC
jgi:hypothetical protein